MISIDKSGNRYKCPKSGIWPYELILTPLTRLFQVYFDLEYYSKYFKKINTIILKKPGKPDYLESKVYRPIALLDTVGKALEIIVSRRLTSLAEKYTLLP